MGEVFEGFDEVPSRGNVVDVAEYRALAKAHLQDVGETSGEAGRILAPVADENLRHAKRMPCNLCIVITPVRLGVLALLRLLLHRRLLELVEDRAHALHALGEDRVLLLHPQSVLSR